MSEARDWEKEAKSQGWVPKEDWQGDPERWTDAEAFVKKGEEILPIVNAKNKELREQINKMSRQVEELLDGSKKFKEFHDDAIKAKDRENQRLIKELEAARKKAITDGDGEAFDAADKQLTELRAEANKKPENGAGELSPDAKKWLEDHPQYETDKKFAALADGIAGRIQDEIKAGKRAQLSTAKFYELLTNEMQDVAPEMFQNPNRSKAVVEDGGSKGGSSKKAKTFENLPDEAKTAFRQFKKQMPDFTEEEYVAQYDWES